MQDSESKTKIIYNIDPEPETDVIQFQTRRERRQQSETPPTRREQRRIERANEYLDLNQARLIGNKRNRNFYPSNAWHLGLIGENNTLLDAQGHTDEQQQAVIDAYRKQIAVGNTDTIAALSDQWNDMQSYGAELDRLDRDKVLNVGEFATRVYHGDSGLDPAFDSDFVVQLREATHRQEWLNDEVLSRKTAADDDLKKAA